MRTHRRVLINNAILESPYFEPPDQTGIAGTADRRLPSHRWPSDSARDLGRGVCRRPGRDIDRDAADRNRAATAPSHHPPVHSRWRVVPSGRVVRK